MIYHMRQPLVPDVRFEWHPDARRVYAIRVGVTPEVGEPIAFDIADRGAATNAVLIWCRGYRAAKAEAALIGRAAA